MSPPSDRASAAEVDLLRTAYEALSAGDPRPAMDLLHPEFQWVEAEAPGYPLAGVHAGEEGVQELAATARSVWEHIAFEPVELLPVDDRVVVLGDVRTVAKGRDTEVVTAFAHVWTFSDGAAVSVRSYMDTGSLSSEARLGELTALADQLLEESSIIRREWQELGAALESAERESPTEPHLGLADEDWLEGALDTEGVGVEHAGSAVDFRDEVAEPYGGGGSAGEPEPEAFDAGALEGEPAASYPLQAAGDPATGEDADGLVEVDHPPEADPTAYGDEYAEEAAAPTDWEDAPEETAPTDWEDATEPPSPTDQPGVRAEPAPDEQPGWLEPAGVEQPDPEPPKRRARRILGRRRS